MATSNTSASIESSSSSFSSAEAGGITESFRAFFESMVGLFSRTDTLAANEDLIRHLSTLGAVWAVVFVIVGVLCLLNGAKFYKVAVIGLALAIGSIGGYWLGTQIVAPPFVVAGCVGILLAVTAVPLMKYAVAIFGGLAGAFLGSNLWAGVVGTLSQVNESTSVNPDAHWIGALIGLIIFGMLAFILFKMSIVLFTCVAGATVAVLGVIALLLNVDPLRQSVADGIMSSQLVVPLLVLVPAVIGFILQEMDKSSDPKLD